MAVRRLGDRRSARARNFSNFDTNRIFVKEKKWFVKNLVNALSFYLRQIMRIRLNQHTQFAPVFVRADGIFTWIRLVVMTIAGFMVFLRVMTFVQYSMQACFRKEQPHKQSESYCGMFANIQGCKDRHCGLLLHTNWRERTLICANDSWSYSGRKRF